MPSIRNVGEDHPLVKKKVSSKKTTSINDEGIAQQTNIAIQRMDTIQDKLIEIVSDSKQWVIDHRKGIVIVPYATFIALVFALFTYRGQKGFENENPNYAWAIFAASCSFVLNFGVAKNFGDEFINNLKMMFGRFGEKKGLFKNISSLFLAGATTAAGFELAWDSVTGIPFFDHPGFQYPAMSSFMFNTISTRMIGSFRVFNMFEEMKNTLRVYFQGKSDANRSILDFMHDLKHYGHLVDITFEKKSAMTANDFSEYVKKFYEELQDQGVRPNNSRFDYMCLAENFTKLALLYITTQTLPLWGQMANKGLEKFSILDFLAENGAVIWACGLSNQLFYWSSGIFCVNSAMDLIQAVRTENHKSKKNLDRINYIGNLKLLLVMGGLATMAFYSGMGMYGEAKETLDKGFAPVVNDTFGNLISAMGVVGSILFIRDKMPLMTQLSAGSIVNFSAPLKWGRNITSYFLGEKQLQGQSVVEYFTHKDAIEFSHKLLVSQGSGDENCIGLIHTCRQKWYETPNSNERTSFTA